MCKAPIESYVSQIFSRGWSNDGTHWSTIFDDNRVTTLHPIYDEFWFNGNIVWIAFSLTFNGQLRKVVRGYRRTAATAVSSCWRTHQHWYWMWGYLRQYTRKEFFSFVVVGGGLSSCLGGTLFDTESSHRNVILTSKTEQHRLQSEIRADLSAPVAITSQPANNNQPLSIEWRYPLCRA